MNLVLFVVVSVVLGLSLKSTSANDLNSRSLASKEKTKYHLKWVTKEPILPIYLDKKIDPPSSASDLDFKWYKYSQNVYLDEIENYNQYYLFSQTDERAALYILEYDTKTHDQLSTYEPRAFSLDDRDYGNDLFTLAFLESHTIDIVDTPTDLVAFCNVSILMPNNNNLLNSINLNLIERNIKLKLGLTDRAADPHQRHNNHRHHNRLKRTYQDDANSNADDDDSSSSRSKRYDETTPKSFIQINLDVGPIQYPKAQLANSANPNVTCRLTLLDIEQDSVVYESEILRSIDAILHENRSKNRRPPSTVKPSPAVAPPAGGSRLRGEIESASSSLSVNVHHLLFLTTIVVFYRFF